MLRSRVAMRLKQNQQAIVMAAARRFERGADFHRMMAVVVNQRDAAMDALDFKTTSDAGEGLDAGADQVGRDVKEQCHRGGSSRVANVVNARRSGQMKDAKVIAAIGEAELAVE